MRPPRALIPLSAALAAACGGAAPERPNVVLISIDTLRADHVGCYGYGRDTTPHLDALAAEGVVFEQHVSSSSWTLPAHAALFTSVSDSVHGCMESRGTALSPAFTTLAERFAAAGYRTAGFYAGPYLHEVFGLGQGFETYRYCVDDGGTYAAERVEEWGLDPVAQERSHQGVTNPDVYAAASGWLRQHRDEPFLLFVHLWDVHYDFTPPPPWDTRFDPGYEGSVDGTGFFFDPAIHAGMPAADREHLIALYDGEIGWTDTFVGRLRAELEELGLGDDTVIAVTSDHGTELFDHGGKGHRTTLFDELIRIPLVLWYPTRLAPRRVAEQTRIVDVGPTLLELADLPPPEGVMGHSLVPLALGRPVGFDNAAVSELYSVGRALRSVRTPRSKVLRDERPAGAGVRWYDLRSDPSEVRPLGDLDSEPGRAARDMLLRAEARLEEYRAARPGAPVAPVVPEDVEQSLREHGYAGDGEPDREPDGGRR